MDPISTLSLLSVGLKVAKAAKKYNKKKKPGKLANTNAAAAQEEEQRKLTAAKLEATLTVEQRKARSEGNLHDILMVLGILGDKLGDLGIVNEAWLPSAREEVLKVFRIRAKDFLAIFEKD